jgi:hypothetical protein
VTALTRFGSEVLLLWGFAALGVYHLIFRINQASKRYFFAANSVKNTANQLRFVMAASFHKKKVMSKAEYRVFRVVEEQVRHQRGYRVLSQTSLGEIIGSDDKRAFNSVNSKRVDILIISSSGHPVAAIEYQGGAHHQGDAAARDAVKKEALRKAGVDYVEVLDTHTAQDVARMVRDVLLRAEAARLPQKEFGQTGTFVASASR